MTAYPWIGGELGGLHTPLEEMLPRPALTVHVTLEVAVPFKRAVKVVDAAPATLDGTSKSC